MYRHCGFCLCWIMPTLSWINFLCKAGPQNGDFIYAMGLFMPVFWFCFLRQELYSKAEAPGGLRNTNLKSVTFLSEPVLLPFIIITLELTVLVTCEVPGHRESPGKDQILSLHLLMRVSGAVKGAQQECLAALLLCSFLVFRWKLLSWS